MVEYEHSTEVKDAGNALIGIIDLAKDETDNIQQIAEFAAKGFIGINAVTKALTAEVKDEYDAKFGGKLGLFIARKLINRSNISDKTKRIIQNHIDAINETLDIALPDSES